MAKKILLAAVALVVLAVGTVYLVKSRPKPFSENIAVPLYPGATTDTDTFATRLSPRDRAKLVKAVLYTTDDGPAKVIAFYKEKLGKEKTQVIETSRRGVPGAVFRTDQGGAPRIVMITSNEDTQKTEILISSVDVSK